MSNTQIFLAATPLAICVALAIAIVIQARVNRIEMDRARKVEALNRCLDGLRDRR